MTAWAQPGPDHVVVTVRAVRREVGGARLDGWPLVQLVVSSLAATVGLGMALRTGHAGWGAFTVASGVWFVRTAGWHGRDRWQALQIEVRGAQVRVDGAEVAEVALSRRGISADARVWLVAWTERDAERLQAVLDRAAAIREARAADPTAVPDELARLRAVTAEAAPTGGSAPGARTRS